MKRRLFVLSMLVLAASVLCAQNAEQIINKHIQAIGGAENWKKINSISITGNLSMQEAELTTRIRILNQVGYREDLAVASYAGFIIMTPDNGWRYLPFIGQKIVETYSDDELKAGRLAVDINRLIDYKQKGHTLELIGYDTIDSKVCYNIKVVYNSGVERNLFIDTKSHLLVRSSEKTILAETDEEAIIAQDFFVYKTLPEGIVVPFESEKKITIGSSTTQVFYVVYQAYDINVQIDKAIFDPGN